MGTLSNEQIEDIGRELDGMWGSVTLQCDGYRVRVEVRPIRTRRYVLSVFVDGWFKGEWLMKDCEERRRFLRRNEISLYRPSEKARLVKTFGKRGVLKYFPDLHTKRATWSSYWMAVRPMLRHFCANNERVEIISIGYVTAGDKSGANDLTTAESDDV